MTAPDPQTGWQLRLYLGLRHILQPLLRPVLKQRLKTGKEDHDRVWEKLGITTALRPEGRLIWLHAVGLGEVLALRPLIAAMAQQAPDLSFLITSTARSSAGVIGANLPPRCIHQFLPLDAPGPCARFLRHWRPDLAVWAEQDLWPGLVRDTARAGIPQAYVNVRMTENGHRRRARLRGLYRDVLARFFLIAAQDPGSATRLRDLGAAAVRVSGSLKPAAAPLAHDPATLAALQGALAGRRIWVAASTHPEDEAEALAAQSRLWAADPRWLLILAPRLPARAPEVAAALDAAQLPFARRSLGAVPAPSDAVWLADSFGEMGLWYRLARVAFIGGGFGGIGGHNPWEAVCLSLPVLHGPDTHNFANDYKQLDAAGLARPVTDAALATAVATMADSMAGDRARALIDQARAALRPLAHDLLAGMDPK